MFPTVGFRPHGIGIESENATHLWESDTNMGAFFKRDMVTGEVVDAILLPDGSPFPHGASVHNGYIYWVDDIGGGNAPVCRCRRSDAEKQPEVGATDFSKACWPASLRPGA